jgi:hypothetical protein
MKFAKSVIFRLNNSTIQQFNFDCGSVPGSVSFRIFRTVKNIRVHPAPSVAKNCGTIALPGRRVPDVSRTGIRRVRPSRSPGKMRRRTAGRVQGVKHTPTPCRKRPSAALFHATGALNAQLPDHQPSGANRSHPERPTKITPDHSGKAHVNPE